MSKENDATSYEARLRRVLEYIDAYLSEDLSLERLSNVASFSKYHFHRQFRHMLGISAFKYVQLRRMKRAVHELAFRPSRHVLDIALDSGYDGPEAFARAFKKALRQSPSEFRSEPNWDSWFDVYQPVSGLRSQHMKPNIRAEQVRIIDFPETKVAALEHRGYPSFIGDSVRKFIRWRKENQLSPKVSATYNIFYNDPETDPENFRLDICASTNRVIAWNEYGIVSKTIPGGRCAVLRHVGADESLDAAIRYLYAEWLPQAARRCATIRSFFSASLSFQMYRSTRPLRTCFFRWRKPPPLSHWLLVSSSRQYRPAGGHSQQAGFCIRSHFAGVRRHQ